jgi:Domain of unknown function (DUF3458_C) ARM repeats
MVIAQGIRPGTPVYTCYSVQLCATQHSHTLQGSSLEERIQSSGRVSTSIVEAFKTVLTDKSLDGAFVSAAITLPDSNELLDEIPNADPTVLHQVRWSLFQQPP